jgi:hypothetical protein
MCCVLPRRGPNDFIYFAILYGFLGGGIFGGMASIAPMYAAMLHFPDRKMLLNILIAVVMPSVALCTYFLLTTKWFNSPVIPEKIGERTIYMIPMLASCYLIHVIVGSLCLMDPPKDKYSK